MTSDDSRHLPATVRARLELALVDAERAFIAAPPQHFQMFVFGPGVHDPRGPGTPAAAADPVREVVAAFEKVVPTVYDAVARGEWPADQLRSATDYVLDQITRRIYTPNATRLGGLEQFTDRVYQALRPLPFWSQLQDRIGECSTQSETAPLEKQLTALRVEARWTVDELAQKVELDRTSVQDHLSGKVIPRLSALKKYETVFSAELNREVKIDALQTPPKPR